MPQRAELMTVQEAIAEYGHTREWWYKQMDDKDLGKPGLTRYSMPGERGWLLSRSDVARFLEPQEGKGAQTA